jgi:transposase
MEKVLEDDYLCYDITSISSYSELNEYIKYGHNRDKEKLPQINLAMLFSQKGRLPVYFQRTPGNITDVTTLHNLLKLTKVRYSGKYGDILTEVTKQQREILKKLNIELPYKV